MLASYAKWYSFTPPQRPNFPPPLTDLGDVSTNAQGIDGGGRQLL